MVSGIVIEKVVAAITTEVYRKKWTFGQGRRLRELYSAGRTAHLTLGATPSSTPPTQWHRPRLDMAQSGQRTASRAQFHGTSYDPATRRDADLGRPNKQKRNTQKNEATIAYVKKILCSRPPTADTDSDGPTRNVEDASLEELLPPLTSSNEVDVELYALIAVILSNFVQTWYNRITPDQQFVSEIVQIIAHCTRGLEQRLRHVDLEGLLLDEVPDLVAAHVKGTMGICVGCVLCVER